MIRDCEERVASGKRQVLDMVAGRKNDLDEIQRDSQIRASDA